MLSRSAAKSSASGHAPTKRLDKIGRRQNPTARIATQAAHAADYVPISIPPLATHRMIHRRRYDRQPRHDDAQDPPLAASSRLWLGDRCEASPDRSTDSADAADRQSLGEPVRLTVEIAKNLRNRLFFRYTRYASARVGGGVRVFVGWRAETSAWIGRSGPPIYAGALPKAACGAMVRSSLAKAHCGLCGRVSRQGYEKWPVRGRFVIPDTRLLFAMYRPRFVLCVAIIGGVLAASRAAEAQTVRKLAPGILTVIAPEPHEEETFHGPISVSLSKLDWTPNFTPRTDTLREKAARIIVRQDVWNLEFAFKPVRMVFIDIPQPTGKMQRKLIWYMVYRVRNLGGHLNPVPATDETYKPEMVDQALSAGASEPTNTLRFFPHFVLESSEVGKSYLDRIIPAAKGVIELREMRGAKLLNSVEISQVSIPVVPRDGGPGLWGVATWEDIDPRIDFFSIYVQGLSNAFQLGSSPAGGIAQRYKTLQLNFWRPGDTEYEHEGEIRYGVRSVTDPTEQAAINAYYNIQQRVDYLWIFR